MQSDQLVRGRLHPDCLDPKAMPLGTAMYRADMRMCLRPLAAGSGIASGPTASLQIYPRV